MEKIDIEFINKLSEQIKTKDGVIDVDLSDIRYNENGDLYVYNNKIRVIFDNTSFRGFDLTKFNTHDANANFTKFDKYLESSDKKLDSLLEQINKSKSIIPKIKNVADYVHGLNLEGYVNIKKVGFSYCSNQLMITIYKEF